ncbi:DsbA family protein [Alkalihalobacterium bogoriense]|uniref:DsbA family protein n=1 Tax=Alkalihalobacterium bogoriense TaxID=246272 RepID=UPI00054D2684|nr:DsbA family protein [Alkalihalobacterium bogoriense]
MKPAKSPVISLFFSTIIVLAVISIGVIWYNSNAQTSEIKFETPPSAEGQPTLGAQNAAVTVVEFGDFKCPACKSWGEGVFPALITDYIVTGQVKFVYINTNFHGEESRLASLAAEAVLKQSLESYWLFHKALYDEQPPHQNHDDVWITEEKILDIGSRVEGVDLELLQYSLENKTERAEVEKDDRLVEEYNINLTPTIMVNGITVEDPFDYERIKELIEKELEGSKEDE